MSLEATARHGARLEMGAVVVVGGGREPRTTAERLFADLSQTRCCSITALHEMPISIGGSDFVDTATTVVAFDGRLYQKDALSNELGVSSDSGGAAIVAAAYRRWGPTWPANVDGEFASAIWDRSECCLILARDAVGVGQLYWTFEDEQIRCATELMALARTRRKQEPNRVQLGLYLVGQYDEREDTLVDGIRALPPAHIAIIRERSVRLRRFWQPGRGRVRVTRQEAAEEFRTVFRLAVKKRLARAGGHVALEFSGGLDSTSVAAMAAQLRDDGESGSRQSGVTLAFPGLPCDERYYSRRLAERIRVPLIEVDPFEYCEALLPDYPPHASGDIYFHPTVAFKWAQLATTRASGIHVTLTGLGSDQIAHREAALELRDAFLARRWRELATNLRHSSLAGVARGVAALVRKNSGTDRARLGIRSAGTLDRELAFEVLSILECRRAELKNMPHEDEAQLAVIRCIQHDLPQPLASLDRMCARSQSLLLHPFLDRALVELILSLPQSVVAGVGNEFRKPLLRHAMEGMLPDVILSRRTLTEFNPFIVRALFECGSDPRHLLLTGVARDSRLFSDAAVRKIARNPTSAATLRQLTAWLAVETWLRALASLGERNGQNGQSRWGGRFRVRGA